MGYVVSKIEGPTFCEGCEGGADCPVASLFRDICNTNGKLDVISAAGEYETRYMGQMGAAGHEETYLCNNGVGGRLDIITNPDPNDISDEI